MNINADAVFFIIIVSIAIPLFLFWIFDDTKKKADNYYDIRQFESPQFWKAIEKELKFIIKSVKSWSKLKEHERNITKVYIFRVFESSVGILYYVMHGQYNQSSLLQTSLIDKIKALEDYYPNNTVNFLHKFRKERNNFIHNVGIQTSQYEDKKITSWLHNLQKMFTTKNLYAPVISHAKIPSIA